MSRAVEEAVLRRLIAEEVERALEPALGLLTDVARYERSSSADRLLTAQEVGQLLGIDVRTLRRLVHEGAVPPPITIGERTLRWRRAVLEEWVRGKEQRLNNGGRRG